MKVGPQLEWNNRGERRGNQKSDFNVWIVKNNEQDPASPLTGPSPSTPPEVEIMGNALF